VSALPPFGPDSRVEESFGSDHRAFAHAVQFYLNEDFLIGLLGRLMRSAYRAGDAVVIIATEKHHDALARHLMHEGRVGETQKHAYVVADAAEMLRLCSGGGDLDLPTLSERCADLISMAAGPRGETQRHVFVYGEIVTLLCQEGKFDSALALEQAWDSLGRRWMISLLCGYPIRQFDQAGFEKFFLRVCAAHSTVSPPDAYPSFECERRIAHAVVHSSWLLDSKYQQ